MFSKAHGLIKIIIKLSAILCNLIFSKLVAIDFKNWGMIKFSDKFQLIFLKHCIKKEKFLYDCRTGFLKFLLNF